MSYQFGPVERDERIDLAADEPLGEAPRRRILPSPLGTALVMALFAGGLWAAYVVGTHHAAAPRPATPGPAVAPGPVAAAGAPAAADAVPLIRADRQPLKVKPEHPGGMPVPDRDSLVYNERPGGPPVEKLLPPPEQPQPRPAPAQVALAPPAAPLPPLPAAPGAETPAPPAARPAPPESLRTATRPVPAPAAASDSHIRVQLGSLRTPKEAWEEWQRLKRANPDLLGRLTADAVRIDLGERGVYYRILAGPFTQPGAARHLCSELKQRRLGCSIVR